MPNKNKCKLIKYNPEEWEIVSKRAAAVGKKTGTYIRDISVREKINVFDMKQFTNLILAFNRIGNEINQLLRVVNSTKSVYQKDVEEMRERFTELDKVFKNYLHPIRSSSPFEED